MADDSRELDFSTVLASSVHDMKNSVGMLLSSLTEAIQAQPPENAEQARRFATLHYEASRINGELIQLLTLYRMQNKHLPVRVEQHYVIDVLEDQLARIHMLLTAREIQWQLQCDDDLCWYYDSDLLGCLIQNILVNCVRYTERRLQISATVSDEMLCLSIADDGPGYPPAMLGEPEQCADEAGLAGGKTQLGLYFASRIAQLHRRADRRGFIRLQNGAPLGGGTFSVFLP